jgi:hypothetical protein
MLSEAPRVVVLWGSKYLEYISSIRTENKTEKSNTE